MDTFSVCVEVIALNIAASVDDGRPYLHGVYFDEDSGLAVATDGMKLAAKPCKEGAPWGTYMKFRLVKESWLRGGSIEFHRAGLRRFLSSCGGCVAEQLEPPPMGLDFHSLRAKLETQECVSITIDAKLLIDLVDAMRGNLDREADYCETCELDFAPGRQVKVSIGGPLDPIAVSAGKSVGFLMPCKPGPDEKSTAVEDVRATWAPVASARRVDA